jgi:hypothetical protein
MDRKNHLLTPLIIAAAASVVTFAGIGVAAITGHLSMNQMSPNPLAGLVGASRPEAAAITAGTTKAKASKARPGTKPIDFRPGSRVAAGKAKCADCGVVDSIRAKEVEDGGIVASDFRNGVRDNGRSYAARSPEASYAVLTPAADARVAVNFVVTLRMEDGTVRTIHENQRPPFSIGERVRLVNGSVVPLG